MTAMERNEDTAKLSLKYIGRDINDRPVYKDADSDTLYVDVNPHRGAEPVIFTKMDNRFDGEPHTMVKDSTEFMFTPKHETLLG